MTSISAGRSRFRIYLNFTLFQEKECSIDLHIDIVTLRIMRQSSRRFPRRLPRGIITSLLLIGGVLGHALPLLAQIETSIGFTPPDEHIGEPRNIGAGGSRGQCLKDPQDRPPLTILAPQLPQSSEQEILRGGLTKKSSPSLFVYVPETTAETADFLLLEHLEDGMSKELHYQEFPLPEQAGIISLSLPVALEAGKTYEWHFALICDIEDRNGDALSVGIIERIASSSQASASSAIAQLTSYGQEGLWYDFFALLTDEKQRSPQLREAWETALRREFGQNSPIPQAPFLACCSIVPHDE